MNAPLYKFDCVEQPKNQDCPFTRTFIWNSVDLGEAGHREVEEGAVSTKPALIICDEAGFGVPIDPAEPRLWVSAVCLPADSLSCLDELNLSKGRRLNTRDRDTVLALFRAQPGLVGAVTFIDATDPEIREYYSERLKIGESSLSGPGLLWSQAIANCCALVVTELHKAGYPYSPIFVTHDTMTMSDQHREGLRSAIESDIPRIMDEVLAALSPGISKPKSAVPQLIMGSSEDFSDGGVMLADFLASASRRSWMRGELEFMAPFEGEQVILNQDITSATLANLRAARNRNDLGSERGGV